MVARYLRGAPLDEIVALAEAWEFDAARAPVVAWKLVLACWVEQDAPGALEAARRIGGKEAALELFALRTWVEVDPAGAVAVAEQEPVRMLAAIIGIVAKGDMAVALGVIERYPGEEALVLPVLKALAESDPRAAVARAESIPEAGLRKKALAAVAAVWAKGDPSAALAWLEAGDGEASETRGLTPSILEGIIESDPDLAAERIAGLAEGPMKYGLMKQLAQRKAKDDPAAALAWAEALPEGGDRKAALSICVKAVTKGDPAKLLAYLEEKGWDLAGLNPKEGQQEFELSGGGGSYGWGGSLYAEVQSAIRGLAREDPEKALLYAAKLSSVDDGMSGSFRARMASDIVRRWFADEPQAALDWIAGNPSASERKIVERDIEQEMSADQRQWVLENAATVKSEVLKEAVIGRMLTGEGAQPDQAMALAETLTGEARDRAFARIAPQLLRAEPEKAFALLDRLPPGATRESAVASFLGGGPIERARGCFEALPEADRTPNAYAALAQGWLRADQEAASQWVAELPPGERRDGAVGIVAMSLIQSELPDFPMALQWAASVGGNEARAATQRNVLNHWLRTDEEAANAAIGAGAFPETVVRNLNRWND